MNVRLIVNWREYQTLCRVSSVTVAKYLKRFSVTEQTQTFSKIYFPWKVSVQLKKIKYCHYFCSVSIFMSEMQNHIYTSPPTCTQ